MYSLDRARHVKAIITKHFPDSKIIFTTQNKVAAVEHGWFLAHGFLIETYNDLLNVTDEGSSCSTVKQKRFLCLGGCPRPNKQFVFCLLLNRGLLNETLTCWSFAKIRSNYGKAWHQSIHPKHKSVIQAYSTLMSKLPQRIDMDDCGGKIGTINLDVDLMRRGKFHIVVETDLGNGKYQQRITEKTLKSIATQTPFLIFGAPYSLQYLHELGFKTFDHVLDESYDVITDEIERCEYVANLVTKLSLLSDDEFDSILTECKEECLFNFKKLSSISYQEKHYQHIFKDEE